MPWAWSPDRRRLLTRGSPTPCGAALRAGRQLRISYWTPARDTVAERTVDPLRVVAAAPWTYLQAYDHGIGQIRTFRLDRVVAAEALDAPVGPPPVEDLPDIPAPGTGAFPAGPHDVVVALDVEPGMRWLADYYPLESSTDQPGGGQRIVLRTPDARWAERFVLRLGGRARVVEPADAARRRAHGGGGRPRAVRIALKSRPARAEGEGEDRRRPRPGPPPSGHACWEVRR